jgi:Mg2+/Co2+ transporter CorC
MPGRLALGDAQRWLETTWDSEADTIGGHVIQVLGRLPVAGDRIVIDGATVEVETLQGRVPGTLVVTPPGPSSGRTA